MSNPASTAFSFLYYKTAGMSAFENLVPITDYPQVFGDVTGLDVSNLSCDYEKQEPGTTSAPDITYGYIYYPAEFNKVYALKNIAATFQLRFGADGEMGCYQFTGKLVPQINGGAFGDTRKASFKIFPSSKVLPVDPTAVFIQPIGDKMLPHDGTLKVYVTTYPEDATLAAVSSATDKATVAVAGHEVTITGVEAGTSVITITASSAGLAAKTETFSAVVT